VPGAGHAEQPRPGIRAASVLFITDKPACTRRVFRHGDTTPGDRCWRRVVRPRRQRLPRRPPCVRLLLDTEWGGTIAYTPIRVNAGLSKRRDVGALRQP